MTTTEPALTAAASRLMRGVPPVALVLAGISLIQLGAVLATVLFDTVDPAGAALLRVVFAASIMVTLWRPLPWPLSRAQWFGAVQFGLVLGTMNLCFYEAIDRIPLGTTVTIQFAGPLLVAVVGRRTALDVLWVILAAAGIVALVGPGGGSGSTSGYVFAAAAGAAWAGYIVNSRRLGQLFDDTRGLALGMCFTCVVPLVPGVVSLTHAEWTLAVIPLAILVALFSSVIPHTFDTEALRRMSPGVFGVLMSLEPAFASLFGMVLLGQLLEPLEWLGVALVVTAAVGVMWPRGNAAVEHA